MGINATYDPISPFTVPLFNVDGSRSDHLVHIFNFVQKLWPLTTLSAKIQQKEIWYPNKNGLIWHSTCWVKPSYEPRLWPVWPLPTIDLQLPFSPVTQYHKTAHTASPNELDQISLPPASMAPGTTFHDPHCHSQIFMEIGHISWDTFLSQKSGRGYWPNYQL